MSTGVVVIPCSGLRCSSKIDEETRFNRLREAFCNIYLGWSFQCGVACEPLGHYFVTLRVDCECWCMPSRIKAFWFDRNLPGMATLL